MLTFLSLIPTTIIRGQSTDTEDWPLRWWKGNIHTHSLWSDGDEFPEMIADWYRSHDYNFLALSDHNILSEGQRWMKASKIFERADEGILDRYRSRFGDEWVETRGQPKTEDFEVRLKPLNEFGPLLNQAGQFIMIPGEEISDSAEGKPVHMNATNLRDLILPVGGATVVEVMQNNLRAVLEQQERTGRPILAHVNHPNFGYAITAEELAMVIQERFFEVYNGHPIVNHLGDENHPSIERMWDVANAIRLTKLEAPPLLGIATDDSHEYHGRPGARPGRAWIMVLSRYLTPEHLIKSIDAGRFYASSGVVLSSIRYRAKEGRLSIQIQPKPNTEFKTEFIVIKKPAEANSLPEVDRIGIVASTQEGLDASYQLADDDLMVRACITSSAAHPDPSFDNQRQQAWTQPIVAASAVDMDLE
jgi:hypothetical protein